MRMTILGDKADLLLEHTVLLSPMQRKFLLLVLDVYEYLFFSSALIAGRSARKLSGLGTRGPNLILRLRYAEA